MSLYWVTSEAIVRLYILYLYRYLYHHHHHCIEWPLEDIVRSYITGNPPSRETFISHWLPHSFNGWISSNFLTKVIYHLSYCDKLHHWEPSLTRSIYQSLTATFFQRMLSLQFPEVNHLSGWIGAGTRCCPQGEEKSICLFFVSCCLSDDVRARIFRGIQITLVSLHAKFSFRVRKPLRASKKKTWYERNFSFIKL